MKTSQSAARGASPVDIRLTAKLAPNSESQSGVRKVQVDYTFPYLGNRIGESQLIPP